MNIKRLISPGGTLLSMLCLFLPFLTSQFASEARTRLVSGFDVFLNGRTTWLIAFFILSLVIVLCSLITRKAWGKFAVLVSSGACIVLTLILAYLVYGEYSDGRIHTASGAGKMYELQFRFAFGWYGFLLGYVTAFAGGLFQGDLIVRERLR